MLLIKLLSFSCPLDFTQRTMSILFCLCLSYVAIFNDITPSWNNPLFSIKICAFFIEFYHFLVSAFFSIYLLLHTAIDILGKKSSTREFNPYAEVGAVLVMLCVRELCKPRCLKKWYVEWMSEWINSFIT